MSFYHLDLLKELTALSQTRGWINGRHREGDERTEREGVTWKGMEGREKRKQIMWRKMY